MYSDPPGVNDRMRMSQKCKKHEKLLGGGGGMDG